MSADNSLKEMPTDIKSGDADKGSQLVQTCAACHGQDGNSINTEWPNLAGQNQKYLYEQLLYFKSGERNNVLMMSVTPYLNSISDEEILDIAAYYASQKSNIGQAKDDPDLLKLGQALYRNGNLEKGIPACTSCHSVYGDGNSQAGFPAIAGQQVGYLISTLKAYRSEERNAGEQALVMQSIAKNLNDQEIDALSNYMHALYE